MTRFSTNVFYPKIFNEFSVQIYIFMHLFFYKYFKYENEIVLNVSFSAF